MIASILIANRGEIACRIIRTARAMGIRTIAVYSDADARAPHVSQADEAVHIGGSPPLESYLDQEKILAAAKASGAQAIHPGYGFLSENADFAEAVSAAGLTWIGAPPAAIRAMGLKDAAKRLMAQAGVRITPGYMGDDQSRDTLAQEAERTGYPVLIKAVAGGGGKGMRRVDHPTDFAEMLLSCQREAAASFGDDRVLIEKYILDPRHIEVQVFGDTHGNVVHLFERDCSLQRRHQKVIEEAPAPGMDAQTRAAICDAAVRAAAAVGYVGAGTIEFIADASDGLRPDRIWFMEMNTRLQVEHPVTEAITGQDLVAWQIRVAAGEPLPLRQDQLAIDGWAMEARLYAENPATGFLPSTGPLDRLRLPDNVRVDTGVVEGGEVSPFYDPLIAKLIVHRGSRAEAAQALAEACGAVEVWPVRTNAAFLARAAADPDFIAGKVSTAFIETHSARLVPDGTPGKAVLQAAAGALIANAPADPWIALRGFAVNGEADTRVYVEVAGSTHMVNLAEAGRPERVVQFPETQVLFTNGEAWPFGPPSAGRAAADAAGDGALHAPMPGRVIAVDVAVGQHVAAGQRILVLEAMKMEHGLVAPFDGTVEALAAEVGAQVGEGTLLARIAKPADT